ncbi:Hypothetical protein NTJ_02815 [Nesidiocoris tenuis]|uniref:Uncharacterized protein n=1 Tax=Nesidiocoris tenuis TaxID=355587 RepID=A0ABN7ADF0_9HEMI|nr:Hypothetical protein NTJ_02815 [Nesidiocoris tenuis]
MEWKNDRSIPLPLHRRFLYKASRRLRSLKRAGSRSFCSRPKEPPGAAPPPARDSAIRRLLIPKVRPFSLLTDRR